MMAYSNTTECYYFYGQERVIISATLCDHMETDRIVFAAIVQLGDLFAWCGGEVRSHIKVKSLTVGNFERKPLTLSLPGVISM